MKFKFNSFVSDTANFSLKAIEESSALEAFSTDNVNAKIDFDKRIGEFTSNLNHVLGIELQS